MRYALVGHGRMGRAIDAVAAARGHVRAAILGRSWAPESLAGAEVAFEFTEPGSAEENVIALLSAGTAVVCGTTGWRPGARLDGILGASHAGLVIAPNFSVGVALFFRVVAHAGRLFGASGLYDPWVLEAHHRGKRDAPSGTARRLAELLAEADPRLASGQLQVASIRAGSEPGRHEVGFDGEHDAIVLRHAARGREGFATGAVLAGEWLLGRKGQYTFDEVVDDLVTRRRA